MLKQINFQNTPIVDIVNDILADATKRGASDIHFDPYENHLLIRIRIDGDLIDYADVPNTYKDYLITRIKTISKMNRAVLKMVPLKVLFKVKNWICVCQPYLLVMVKKSLSVFWIIL